MKNNVRIDHNERAIVITKDFAKKSSIPGSDEYRSLLAIRRDNREYSVVVRSSSKRSGGTSKIRLVDMRAYISKHDDAEGTIMKAFEAMVNEEAGENLKRTSFFAIKRWFFQQYKDLKNIA